MVVTGPVKLFGNLEAYPVHKQIHGLVPIELYALVDFLSWQKYFNTLREISKCES